MTREADAEGCPDTAELSAHVARLRGGEGAGARGSYQVTFSHRSGVYRAAIRMGVGGGLRVLQDRGPSCASLEQATALTLALLLDSDAHELTVEEHEPEPPRVAPPEPAPVPTVREPPEPLHDVHGTLSVGGAGLFGVLGPAAPALLVDAGIVVNRFHGGVGALWMPAQQLSLAPGHLSQTLLAGVARSCYAAMDRRPLRVELCTGIYAGLVHVEASGYTRNEALKRAWLAVPLEASLSARSGAFGLELGVTALLPLRQSDFAIDNLGTAYDSWRVGGLLSLRAVSHILL
ncbi:MAG: hypothetical protein EOO73_10410 [Myxococcales bacterium]|nr:MAG: hypothetical protein EOO73_10410 [Myxococcales bacterium]